MKPTEAIKKAGGAMKLAALLGVTHQAVYAWRWRDQIPELQALRLRMLKPHWFRKSKGAAQ